MGVAGFYLLLVFITMAFWLLIFLASFVPYWIALELLDHVNPALAEKLAFIKVDSEEDQE